MFDCRLQEEHGVGLLEHGLAAGCETCCHGDQPHREEQRSFQPTRFNRVDYYDINNNNIIIYSINNVIILK